MGVEIAEEDLLRRHLPLRSGREGESLPRGALRLSRGVDRRRPAGCPLDLARWAIGAVAILSGWHPAVAAEPNESGLAEDIRAITDKPVIGVHDLFALADRTSPEIAAAVGDGLPDGIEVGAPAKD